MNILKVELRKISKGLTIWVIALSAILFMYIMFFPSMKNEGFDELVKVKMNMMPDAFKEAFGLENVPNFSIYTEYLSYVLQYIMIAVSIYALMLGTKALASEEQEKTIEFQMANPISRGELVTYKMLAGFIAVSVVMIALLLTSLLGGAIYSNTEYFMPVTTIVKMSIIPAYIFLFIGFALSVTLKKSMATPGTVLGIFFGTYLIGIMAEVVDKIKWMKYLSPSNYVLASDVLKSSLVDKSKGDFGMTGIYIGVILIGVSVIVTYWRYRKKDMDI